MAARFVSCFGTPSFYPKTPNIGCRESFRSTNAFATSTIFKLSVLSLWTWRTIKWFSRQSEVVERRYVSNRFMAENDRSLTALAAGMTRKIFASALTWGTKVFVVALDDGTNSTSSFTVSIVDSGKYLSVSSCAFNLSPLKSSFYNWRTSPKGSSKSSPRRERKNNSCIFLNTIQSVCSATLIALYVHNNIIIIFQFKT